MKTLTGLWPNLARAYEIALLGGFTITVTYPKYDYVEAGSDYKQIKEFYKGIEFIPEGDIWIEITKPRSYKEQKWKTLKDIHARVSKAKENPLPEVRMCSAGDELLKTAVQRLDLSLESTNVIKKIAQVTAQLDGEGNIQAHHIAEAIHYRAILGTNEPYVIAEDATLKFGKYISVQQGGLDSMYADEEKNIKEAIKYLNSLL